jgi:hypothetical protein
MMIIRLKLTIVLNELFDVKIVSYLTDYHLARNNMKYEEKETECWKQMRAPTKVSLYQLLGTSSKTSKIVLFLRE